MTREEFEQGYAERSGITVEQLRALGRIVRPCRCGQPGCEGWQSISRAIAEAEDRDWPEWGGAEQPMSPNRSDQPAQQPPDPAS